MATRVVFLSNRSSIPRTMTPNRVFFKPKPMTAPWISSQKRTFSEKRAQPTTAAGPKIVMPPSAVSKGSSVFLPGSVDLSKLRYEEAKKNALGAQFVPLSYDSEPGTQKTLKVQTPLLRAPFGIKQFQQVKEGGDVAQRPKLFISLEGAERSPEIKKLNDFLVKFDEKMISFALKEGKNWFKNKALPVDVLRYNYKTTIRAPKDEKYGPTMSLKLPTYTDGRFSVTVFGPDNEVVPLENIKQNAQLKLIMEPRSLYFISGNWGVTWSVLQIKVEDFGQDIGQRSQSGGLSEYAFIE